jgi:5-hydroxyisourate hydrolase-like protein (transthyretin family)
LEESVREQHKHFKKEENGTIVQALTTNSNGRVTTHKMSGEQTANDKYKFNLILHDFI